MKTTLLIILFFICANAFCAQVDTTKQNITNATEMEEYDPSLRLVVGFGAVNASSSVSSNVMISSDAGLIYQNGFNLASIFYVQGGGLGNGPFPSTSLKELTFCYGVGLHGAAGLLSANVGVEYLDKLWPVYFYSPGISSLSNVDTNSTIHSHGWGYTLQLYGLWNFAHHIGMGMMAYWNFNNLLNDNGVILVFEFGWF